MHKNYIYQLKFCFYRFFLDFKIWLWYKTLIITEARMDMLFKEGSLPQIFYTFYVDMTYGILHTSSINLIYR